jgi:hypothetical protein
MKNKTNEPREPIDGLTQVIGDFVQSLQSGFDTPTESATPASNAAKTVALTVPVETRTSAADKVGGVALEFAQTLNPIRSNGSGSFFKNLFLSPVVRGLLGLFGGGGKTEEVLLEKYRFPEATQTPLGAELRGGSFATPSADSFGLSREPQRSMPVQISIQALDARSILDRGDEIADAVRQAMLANHAVNDQVGEL